MRLTILRECYVTDDLTQPPVQMFPGDTIDIPEHHANAAIVRGLAIPVQTIEDAQAGAPPREKRAKRGAAEYK